MDVQLLISLGPFSAHLAFFQALAITNRGEINSLVHVSFCILCNDLQDRFLEVGLQEQRANTHAVLLNVAKFPSSGMVAFCIFTSCV